MAVWVQISKFCVSLKQTCQVSLISHESHGLTANIWILAVICSQANSVLHAVTFLFLVALIVKNHKSSFDLWRGNRYERDSDKTRLADSLRTDQNKDGVRAM